MNRPNLQFIYSKYPTASDCISKFETIRWQAGPICPRCDSQRFTPIESQNRYHCNGCNTKYSVMAGTIFHKSHVDLRKWFLLIAIVMDSRKSPGVRWLARVLGVNKNTANYMLMRIRHNAAKSFALLLRIRDEVMNDEQY